MFYKEYEIKETLLHLKDVSLSYGGKKIIKGINLEIKNIVKPNVHQGQVVAFLGRSGRGKSSLFRLITGLEQPTTGEILIPDYSKPLVDGLPATKKVKEGDVGFVDQKYTLFRHKTIYDALYFSLRKTDISAEEKQQKIMTYLKDWGLEKCKDQYPNELSGGQRQRTAILEQLLNSSNYLVLDEPFSGLDVGNIQNVKDAIRLIDQTGDLNTVLFSTHDIELAVELADTIYIIGYPPNETVGTVVKLFDLKEMGIGWKQEFTEDHRDLCNDIKEVMLNS